MLTYDSVEYLAFRQPTRKTYAALLDGLFAAHSLRRLTLVKSVIVYCVISLTSTVSLGGEINFSLTSKTVSENATSFAITVTRTGDSSAAAGVKVTSTDGTATSPADFTAVDTTLTWAIGDSDPKSVDITVNDNSVQGPTKNFSLVLSDVTGDTIGSISTLSVTITDYEEGKIEFGGATFSANEGTKVARVSIIRTEGTDGEISVTITSTDDTAVSDADYISASSSVVLSNNQSATSFSIALIDDFLGEPDKSFKLTLSAPAGGATLGTLTETVVAIIDEDSDFTTNAAKITPIEEGVIQSDLIDLSANSALDNSVTYLELLNSISVLSEPNLAAAQLASGLIEIPYGTDTIFLRPTNINRNILNIDSSVIIDGTGTIEFVTSGGLIIVTRTAVAALGSLRSQLALLQLPKMTISELGNVLIQVDQGPPTYEKLTNGKVVISNSFYDKWNIRPMPIVSDSQRTQEGLELLNHPVLEGEAIVAHYFKDGTDFKVQYFLPTALDETDLVNALKSRIGTLTVKFLDYGLVEIDAVSGFDVGKIEKVAVTLFPDFKVSRVKDFSSSMRGFKEYIDVDGDGVQDYLMVYASGYQQVFFTKAVLPLKPN